MNHTITILALTLGLAVAAPVARTVEVLDATGRVVASGALSGHLTVRGDLAAGRTLRVTTGGRVQTFTLAAPIAGRAPEAERLGVRVGQGVVSLDDALDDRGRGGADDGPNHDAGDDHGGDRNGGNGGGHGADDGAGHDAGDDHGGDGGGHGADDGPGHDAGDDHGGRGGGGGGGGGHGGGHK